MRSSNLKIILTFFLLVLSAANSYALDTSAEEATCVDIGFKRKTPPFANCVLELLDRKDSNVVQSNDPDDATCRKYGFKPKSAEYGSCRLQIDQARQDSQRQQAQYLQQQQQYQAQLEEQKRQRRVATGLALMQMGAGNSGTYSANPPSSPSPTRTYTSPGGKMMNCTTTGNMTNCF